MPDFGILDSQFRLIETNFDEGYVVFRALELATGEEVRILTPDLNLESEPTRIQAFYQRGAELQREGAGNARFFAAGVYDQRSYLVTDWDYLPSLVMTQAESVKIPVVSSNVAFGDRSNLETPPSYPATARPVGGAGFRGPGIWIALVLLVGIALGTYLWAEHRAVVAYQLELQTLKSTRETIKTVAVASQDLDFREIDTLISQAKATRRAGRTRVATDELTNVGGRLDDLLQNVWAQRLTEERKLVQAAFDTASTHNNASSKRYQTALLDFRRARQAHEELNYVVASDAYNTARQGFVDASTQANLHRLRREATASRARALEIDPSGVRLREADSIFTAAEQFDSQEASADAITQYEIALRKYNALADEQTIAELETLRAEVQSRRLEALAVGAASLPRFLDGNERLKVADGAMRDSNFLLAKEQLLEGLNLFDQTLSEIAIKALSTRLVVLTAELRDKKVNFNTAATAQLQRNAERAVADQNYQQAQDIYSQVISMLLESRQHAKSMSIAQLRTAIKRRNEELPIQTQENSVNYQGALSAVNKSDEAVCEGNLDAAHNYLLRAEALVDIAEQEGAAWNARRQLELAFTQAKQLDIGLETRVLSNTKEQLVLVQQHILQHEYVLAHRAATNAHSELQELIQQQWKTHLDATVERLREKINRLSTQDTSRVVAMQAITAAAKFRSEMKFEQSSVLYASTHRLLDKQLQNTQLREQMHTLDEMLVAARTLGIAGDLLDTPLVTETHAATLNAIASAEPLSELELSSLYQDLKAAQARLQKVQMQHAKQAAEAVRSAALTSGAADVPLFQTALAAYERGLLHEINEQPLRAFDEFNEAQRSFDEAALYWAASNSKAIADDRREQVKGLAAFTSPQLEQAKLAYLEATQHWHQSDFALAAKAFLASASLYQGTLRARAENVVSQARSQAERARASVSSLADDGDYRLASGNFERAGALAEQGAADEAANQYLLAAEQFEDLNRRETSLKAKRTAHEHKASALSHGVRDTDERFRQAMLFLSEADEHHSDGNFHEAQMAYRAAHRDFVAALTALTTSAYGFAAGATSDEIDYALGLCERLGLTCERKDFAGERRAISHLQPYSLQRDEVTNEEYDEFVRTYNHQTESEKRGHSFGQFDDATAKLPGVSWRSPYGPDSSHRRYPAHPAIHVSYHDASAYCIAKGGRLPSEDEWEFAARGADRRQFPWGNDWNPDALRWAGDPASTALPVGSFPEFASAALHNDLAGGVWEWTSTTHADARILKGGSWLVRNPVAFRASHRRKSPADMSYLDVGFRCAFDLDKWPD